MIIPIKINNIDGAKRFIDWATNQEFEVYLSSDTNIMVNAKSFLGVCALVGKEVNIVVGDHVSSEEFTSALKKLMLKF